MNTTVPAEIVEQITVRKFGGPEPSACHEEDLIETTTLTLKNGVPVVAQETIPGPAADGDGG